MIWDALYLKKNLKPSEDDISLENYLFLLPVFPPDLRVFSSIKPFKSPFQICYYTCLKYVSTLYIRTISVSTLYLSQ